MWISQYVRAQMEVCNESGAPRHEFVFPARELLPYLMSSKDFMALNLGCDLFYHWGSQKSYLGSGYLVTFLSVVPGRVFGESPLVRI